MLLLRLGVIDQFYADATRPKRVRKARKGKQRPVKTTKGSNSPPMSTGDVANILEHEYGVMGAFYNLRKEAVHQAIADSMAGAIDNLIAGAPAQALANPLAEAQERIAEEFREYIDTEGLAGWHDGVPTKAALEGVSHRFKHPHAKGHPRRPSFVDTGLYRNSFKAWFEGFRALIGGNG